MGASCYNSDCSATHVWVHELVLEHGQEYLAAAPLSAIVHVGNGTNIVYVDPENDIVAVVRWIANGAINEFVEQLLASVERR